MTNGLKLSTHTILNFRNPEKERDYIELFSSVARSYGLLASCKYGQGFFSFEPLLIKNLMHLVEDDAICITNVILRRNLTLQMSF